MVDEISAEAKRRYRVLVPVLQACSRRHVLWFKVTYDFVLLHVRLLHFAYFSSCKRICFSTTRKKLRTQVSAIICFVFVQFLIIARMKIQFFRRFNAVGEASSTLKILVYYTANIHDTRPDILTRWKTSTKVASRVHGTRHSPGSE